MSDATTRLRLPEPSLEQVGDVLARFRPAKRRAAEAAIVKLRIEIEAVIVYQASGAFWQGVREIGAFTLRFIASPDFFDVIEISLDGGPPIAEMPSLGLVRGVRLHNFPMPGPHRYHQQRVERRRRALLQRFAGLPAAEPKRQPFGVAALLRFARRARAAMPEGCWRAAGLRQLLTLLAQERVVMLRPEAASLFEWSGAGTSANRLSAAGLRQLISMPGFGWHARNEVSGAQSPGRKRPTIEAKGDAASAASDGEGTLTDNLVSVAEMRKDLGHILNRAHYADEVVTVAKREKPFVAIISEKESRNLAGMREIADDLAIETATLVDRLQSVDREELRRLIEAV